MTRISGRKAAIASRNGRHAENASARSAEASLPGRDPTSGGELAAEPVAIGHLLDHQLDRGHELGVGLVGTVGLEDPGLRLHDLAQGPEGDAVAVGQASTVAPEEDLGLVIGPGEELPDEPALPHAGLAGDGHELDRCLADHPPIGLLQQLQLGVSTDERAGGPVDLDGVSASGLGGAPDRDGIGLALDLDRVHRLVVDHLVGRPPRPLADHHRPGGRDLLEARRGVHHVAGDHPLTLFGAGAEGHDRLAGVHRDADREVGVGAGLVQLVEGLDDPQAGADRPLGIVLVGDRRPEDGHDRVTDELLDRAAVAFDLGPQQGVVRAQGGQHLLRIGAVRGGREADQVGEEDRDDLPLLAARRRGIGQRRPARQAEASVLGVLGRAGWADPHVAECTRAGSGSTPAGSGSGLSGRRPCRHR